MGNKESGLQWDSMGQRVLRKGKPLCLLELGVLAAASWADRVLFYGTWASGTIPAALLSPHWGVGITTELTLLQTEDLISARYWAGAASACKTSCNVINVRLVGSVGCRLGGFASDLSWAISSHVTMGYPKPYYMSYPKPCYTS